MIEVHVRNDDRGERGKIGRIEARLDEPRREQPDVAGEDRIGDEVDVVHLHERGGVPNPKHRQTSVGSARIANLVRKLRRLWGSVDGSLQRASNEAAPGGAESKQ
jgi:hypothetical protein